MKKCLLLVSLVVLMFGSIFPATGITTLAESAVSVELEKTRKLNIISFSENSGEYTYEEKGEIYKVVEDVKEIGKDGSKKVISNIYKMDDKGKFKKEYKKVTHFNSKKNTIELTTIDPKGEKKHETIGLNIPVDSSLTLETEGYELVQPFGPIYPGQEHISPWLYVGTNNYSDNINNLTVHGIIIAIGATVVKYGNPTSAFWSSILTPLASTIFEMNADYLYYTQHEHQKVYTNTLTRLPAAKRTYTYIYTDKYKTTLVPGRTYPIREEIWYKY